MRRSYNPDDPQWINRDRFVLSAGHGSMFLYSWLHMSGYDLSMEEVSNFRVKDSKTPGRVCAQDPTRTPSPAPDVPHV